MLEGPPPISGGTVDWVFLDRDGTVNVKPAAGEYVESADDLQLLPGAGAGVRLLNDAGIWVGLVTNQRGVALGRMSAVDLEQVHERLQALLAVHGARLDALYACPHGLDECDCRKPGPGMMLKAQSEHPELDFRRAAIVGDSVSDIEAGRRLGLRTVAIGAADGELARRCDPDHQVADLLEGARLLTAVSQQR
jgi:D-glycero-D-manno-heptose 1,7-bisphosphate phosphatase